MGLLCFSWFWNASVFSATNITSVDFKDGESTSEVTIEADGPITFEKQQNIQNKQISIDLKEATIGAALAKSIDTSSFAGKVANVNSFQAKDNPKNVRIVMQLREDGDADVVSTGNKLVVKIPHGASVPPLVTQALPIMTAPAPVLTSDAPDQSHLSEFISNKKTQEFKGRPITLQVRDVDVTDVLRLIGEASGFNMVIGDDVKGKVTLSLVDVPWDQALDVVLHTQELGADRNKGILRVMTLKKLLAEKQGELDASQALLANTPRVTRIFPVSYADLGELTKMVNRFIASSPSGGSGSGSSGGGGSGSSGGLVESDHRTNSLVVRDVPDNLEKIKKLIELLDGQTPQVMIEAKIVEASEGFTKSLGGSLGLGLTGSTPAIASFSGGNPIDPLVGTPGVFTTGSGVSKAGQGSFGLSPSLSFIPGGGVLNAVLNLAESENQVKVVASPKLVVLNKQSASIVSGTPILVPGTTTQNGITVPADTVQSANISLKVTPTVTNDGAVLLTLTVDKDVPSDLGNGHGGVGKRSISTLVIVESGTTLVIGGIYSMQTTHSESGIPFLRKLPIIGALFGTVSDSTTRSELFIFITPRILNAREAGLVS